ncbi:MAG TPA: 5-oxoprolinase subunit PxpA [Marmoricola sp.]|nr:5-oxoprolinase subunit PxpA [Marmoricola sp.]
MYPETAVVDLNADLGEEVTEDAALLEIVSSANVACGFHAGNEQVMREVCVRAAGLGVAIGAQVSYADREGFGRRPMEVPAEQLSAWVAEQVAVLSAIALSAGTQVRYVKAHGALYNRIADDAEQAAAVLAGSGGLPVLGLPGSRVLVLAEQAGRSAIGEGFPDRGYTAQGRLVPRDQPGALVAGSRAVAEHAVELAGREDVRTVCVHGDSADAVQTARAVRAALLAAGFDVRPWSV